MKRFALLALIFIVGCGSLGAAQPHALSLAYKAGDTYKYKFHSTTTQTAGMAGGMTFPVEIDMSAGESVKVNSVDAGVAAMTITLSDFSLKTVAAGVTNTTTGLPTNTVDVKVGADGTIVSLDGNPASSSNPFAALTGIGGGFFITAVLPSGSVKPGDTWTKTYDQKAPIGSGTVRVVSDSKYVRDESFNGVSAAVVETKSTGTIDVSGSSGPATSNPMAGFSVKGTFTTDVTTWIDPNGHRVMKSHSAEQDDLTLNFPTTSPDKSPLMMQGPVTAKGEGTTDLTPA